MIRPHSQIWWQATSGILFRASALTFLVFLVKLRVGCTERYRRRHQMVHFNNWSANHQRERKCNAVHSCCSWQRRLTVLYWNLTFSRRMMWSLPRRLISSDRLTFASGCPLRCRHVEPFPVHQESVRKMVSPEITSLPQDCHHAEASEA